MSQTHPPDTRSDVAVPVELGAETAGALATVHAWGQAFNDRELDRLLSLSAPDIEIATPHRPERGHDAVRRLLHLQSYGVAQHVRARRYIARARTVVVDALIELRWVDSGDLAETTQGAAVFDVSDGHISRFRPLPDLASAFRLAGWTGHADRNRGRHSSTHAPSV
jgi:SnoaL-like domain